MRKRNPFRCSALRSSISGFVLTPLIRPMISLRLDRENMSTPLLGIGFTGRMLGTAFSRCFRSNLVRCLRTKRYLSFIDGDVDEHVLSAGKERGCRRFLSRARQTSAVFLAKTQPTVANMNARIKVTVMFE